MLIHQPEFIDGALKGFSGYIAVDELYDGPFCYISLVDAQSQQRILFHVLEGSPEKEDIAVLLSLFKIELVSRGLSLQGITTDGSPLYPEAIKELFPGAGHQICRFHVIKEINKSVLRSVAAVRRELKAGIPARPRGRPTAASRQVREEIDRLDALHKDLFDHRYLFVRRELDPSERETLERISEPFPELRQIRGVVEEMHLLYDGQCKTVEALKKLEALRERVNQMEELAKSLKRLSSENMEKSLTYLDTEGFPGTSNAVERGNRRHRKMQKSVYRVRTLEQVRQRIALDMLRERGMKVPIQVFKFLHAWRCG